MRVIKKVLQEYKHKCKYCKSIYTYTHADIDHSFCDYIRCPVCKALDHTSIFDKEMKGEIKW